MEVKVGEQQLANPQRIEFNELNTFCSDIPPARSYVFLARIIFTLAVSFTFTDHTYFFSSRKWNVDLNKNVLTDAGPLEARTNGSVGKASFSVDAGDKYNQSLGINFGMKHQIGEWKLDWDYSHSRATNRYDYLPDGMHKNITGAPNMSGVKLALSGLDFSVSDPEGDGIYEVTQYAGPDMFDMANYTWDKKTGDSQRYSLDRIKGFKFKARRDFQAGELPYWIEVGASKQSQKRHIEKPNRAFTYVGPALDVMDLAEFGHVRNLGFDQMNMPNAYPSNFVLVCVIHSASVQDRAKDVLKFLEGGFGWIRKIWADGG